MITGIAIENFKGIRDRVEIQLRPITLLFGANSSGKSTILHALQYAREIFERKNLDPDKTIGTGDFVDLGGFQQLVHGHDLNRSITLRLSFTPGPQFLDDEDPAIGMVDYDALDEYLELDSLMTTYLQRLVAPAAPSVEVKVSWSHQFEKPFVSQLQLFDGEDWIAAIDSEASGKRVMLRINEQYKAPSIAEWYALHLADIEDDETLQQIKDGVIPKGIIDQLRSLAYDPRTPCIQVLLAPFRDLVETDGQGNIYVGGIEDALVTENDHPQWPLKNNEWEQLFLTTIGKVPANSFYLQMAKALRDLLLAPIRRVTESLTEARYLGPIRDLPERSFHPPRYPDSSRWASGLGAWDVLASEDDKLLESANAWLSSPDRLNTGYEIGVKRFKKIDTSDRLIRDLLTGRAFDDVDEGARFDIESIATESEIVIHPVDSTLELKPNDLGIGISQVVPVVVTALDGENRLLSIEQPELHLHPKVQAEIADLFVEAIHSRKHQLILETHSEHLILRLLRRIRESEKGVLDPDRQLRTEELGIYYAKQVDGCTQLNRIDVDVNGEFIQPWPDDFFEIDFYERFS